MIGAHFDNGTLMVVAQLQQGQRHADLVVQVSLGCQHRPALPHDRCNHLLDGRLAARTCHCDHRNIETLSPGCCRHAERFTHILDNDLRQLAVDLFTDHQSGRAGGFGSSTKLVTIKARARQGEEHVTFRQRACIRGYAREQDVVTVQFTLRIGCDEGQAFHQRDPPSIACAVSASEK